jgi:hypothetical protein
MPDSFSQLYSLISQKHAEAALDNAEAALHENLRMRAIAVVTCIFLPPTAVAVSFKCHDALINLGKLIPTLFQTFFSTSFWNWGPTDKSKVVSGWIWVYFLLTFMMTMILLLILYGMSNRRKKKATKTNVMKENNLSA